MKRLYTIFELIDMGLLVLSKSMKIKYQNSLFKQDLDDNLIIIIKDFIASNEKHSIIEYNNTKFNVIIYKNNILILMKNNDIINKKLKDIRHDIKNDLNLLITSDERNNNIVYSISSKLNSIGQIL